MQFRAICLYHLQELRMSCKLGADEAAPPVGLEGTYDAHFSGVQYDVVVAQFPRDETDRGDDLDGGHVFDVEPVFGLGVGVVQHKFAGHVADTWIVDDAVEFCHSHSVTFVGNRLEDESITQVAFELECLGEQINLLVYLLAKVHL